MADNADARWRPAARFPFGALRRLEKCLLSSLLLLLSLAVGGSLVCDCLCLCLRVFLLVFGNFAFRCLSSFDASCCRKRQRGDFLPRLAAGAGAEVAVAGQTAALQTAFAAQRNTAPAAEQSPSSSISRHAAKDAAGSRVKRKKLHLTASRQVQKWLELEAQEGLLSTREEDLEAVETAARETPLPPEKTCATRSVGLPMRTPHEEPSQDQDRAQEQVF